jgi:hypothetical protein
MEVAVKTAIQLSFLSLLIILCSSADLRSQSYQGMYMHIDYLHVPADRESSFKDMVRSSFKPIQNARKQNGSIHSWYLYKVSYPGVPNSTHNYVAITLSNSLSAFEDMEDQLSGQLSTRERERMLQNYRRHLSPTHSELWRIQNSVIGEGNEKPSRYMVMNYMNVGLGFEYEYQMMEDEVARPLHEQRMENGAMVGWELNSLIVPGGTNYGHNFSTIDYFERLEDMEFGFTDELIRQTHPDTNINEFFQNIYRTRDLVRSEVWELVESL